MKSALAALVLGIIFLGHSHTSAVTVGKTSLPDTWQLDNITLVLNGAGIREYGFLKIAVYAGALYLPNAEKSADKILAANSPKVVHLKMFRDVSAADSVAAWRFYLLANCTLPCDKENASFVQNLQSFEKAMPEAKLGDTQTFIFINESVVWRRNDKEIAQLKGTDFTRALLASWIGETPTTVNLKDALLGKK